MVEHVGILALAKAIVGVVGIAGGADIKQSLFLNAAVISEKIQIIRSDVGDDLISPMTLGCAAFEARNERVKFF